MKIILKEHFILFLSVLALDDVALWFHSQPTCTEEPLSVWSLHVPTWVSPAAQTHSAHVRLAGDCRDRWEYP